MANGNTRGERLQIMLSAEELVALDDFRFKAKMPSRAAAIRELLKRGLAATALRLRPSAPSPKTSVSLARLQKDAIDSHSTSEREFLSYEVHAVAGSEVGFCRPAEYLGTCDDRT